MDRTIPVVPGEGWGPAVWPKIVLNTFFLVQILREFLDLQNSAIALLNIRNAVATDSRLTNTSE